MLSKLILIGLIALMAAVSVHAQDNGQSGQLVSGPSFEPAPPISSILNQTMMSSDLGTNTTEVPSTNDNRNLLLNSIVGVFA